MLRFINALYMARNQIWRLWVIWLISLDPASAVSLVNGTLGDSVYFHQFVYWNAPLEWRFGEFGDDTVVAVKPFYKAPYCYPEYQGRCELTNEGALRLNNLTYTDQGQYVFIVGANHPYANQIVYYRLQIFPSLSAPVLILKSSHGDLVSGSNVTFYCDSGHQNITTYTFYRDGKNICVESHVTCSGSSLYFQPITASDSGAYTCAIQNLVSTSTSNTLLVNVSAILTAPTLVPISTLRHPVNGTYVSLQCDAGGQDVTAYTFYRNKKNICTRPHVTCRGSKLYFQPITASDGGSYTCTIQNRVSNSTSNTLRLNVFVVQSAAPALTSNITGWVWEGDTVSFHCTTETGIIEWHLDGDVLPKDGRYNLTGDEAKQNSTLIISPVFKNDTGVYTCVVDNNSSNAVNLSVAKSPDSSSISCGSSSSGDGLVLVCSWTGGDPAAEIELSFNGTADKGLDTVNRTVILGDDVQQPDFVCKGNQLGKTSECNITFERPQDTNHDNNAISTVTEGGDATLKVSITNSLNSTFSWFRLNPEVNITNDNKNTIQSSGSESTLTIKSVTASENGTYECRARNIIGSTTFRFNVEVKTQESKGSGGLSGGAIAGIVIGVIAGVALIGVGGFFLVKKLK